MPGRSYQTKPGFPSGCQVNIKCFYVKRTCLGSNYRNINSLTLVQKVIPGYLQRNVDNYSRAYLWLIPMIFRLVFPSWLSGHQRDKQNGFEDVNNFIVNSRKFKTIQKCKNTDKCTNLIIHYKRFFNEGLQYMK
jgi:hypothetical protein